MGVVTKLTIFCAVCIAQSDSRHILEREKRFVMQPNFPTPTTYPVPKLPNSDCLNSEQQPFLTGADILKSFEVHCPVKRSTSVRRVLLDDRLMQELYLTLIGNFELSGVAGNFHDATIHFPHVLKSAVNNTHFHHRNKHHKKSALLSDLKKYHSWYNSVMKDMHVQNRSTDVTVKTVETTDSIEAVLKKIGITKEQLRQLLGLVNEVDTIKDFRLSNKRVKRDTTGAIRSQQEYCKRRGVPTGTGYLHMCSSCAMTTEFPEDMFPRYVSEVTCDQSDCDCFTIKNTAHGSCQPMLKSIKMLKRKTDGCRMIIKNGQQILVDDWEIHEQTLHVGCECMFKVNSMYAAFIPRQ